MGMTRREYLAKDQIRKKLSEEGYPTYSYLIEDFDIHLTKDPEVIGYMLPGKGVITLNEGLDIDQVSLVVRHEILHEYFNHAKRFQDKLGIDLFNSRSQDEQTDMNISGDFDISNRGYTEKDKQTARKIKLNGEVLSGLVIEDHHPDWLGLSVEEMYDRLRDLRKKEQEKMKQDLKDKYKDHDQNYIDIYNKIIDKYGSVSDEELQDVIKRFQAGEDIL